MNEKEKEAIERIKKDDEYYDILENIKQNKYNMWNVEKLMRDTTNGNYTEYEIAQSIVYLSYLIEKKQKELDQEKEKRKEALNYMYDLLNEDYPNVGTSDINILIGILED